MSSEEWNRPFTKAEMDAMRRATREEGPILTETMDLLRRLARRIPFAEDALALYYCARDPMTEARVKFIILGALAYLVMPIDTVPDILPLFGFTDDAAVLATAIAAVRGSIQPRHREKARDTLGTFE